MDYPIFTEEMKKDYTILVPTMLPVHFSLIINSLNSYGYNAVLLENKGKNVVENGLKYVHNDTCYPAQVVIGQLIDAIESGEYDKNKVALLITQTGGGCRASNYIHLLRKALVKAGYEYIPVISLNFSGLESEHTGFKVTIPIFLKMFYSILVGDLLMCLKNQCLPYVEDKNKCEELEKKWIKLASEILERKKCKYKDIKKLFPLIVKDFFMLPRKAETKVKVGIVGEIFVKFSPLGNNELENFLNEENAQVVMAGLLDFCLYCIYNTVLDYKLYGMSAKKALLFYFVYKYVLKLQKELIKIIQNGSDFTPPSYFENTVKLTEGYVGLGAKMGEGWLLTAEMLELIEGGVENVICVQPFGCLPNHIVGKGMMKLIKEKNIKANIVAVDYDASATKVNQENRIKLMLSTAKQAIEENGDEKVCVNA